METESYLDTGNRAFFSNAGLALILHPEFHVNAGLRCWETDACAPLVVTPDAVRPIWQTFADRAVTMGYQPPTFATSYKVGSAAAKHFSAALRREQPESKNGGDH